MADVNDLKPGEILADTSVAEFIKELGLGIANAQKELDTNSVAQLIELANTKPEFSDKSLLELGLVPPFYHYQHADLQVGLQLSMRVQKDLGLDLGLKFSQDEKSDSVDGTQSQGQMTIKVRQGAGDSAKGVVKLNSPQPGTLTVGASTLSLVTGTPSANEVQIVTSSIFNTAKALATKVRSADVPAVDRVLVEPVAGAGEITPTSPQPAVFQGGPNKVTVLSRPDQPARAVFSVTSNQSGSLTLQDDPAFPFGVGASLGALNETLATNINQHADYSAGILFKDGQVPTDQTPHFAFDDSDVRSQDFETLKRVARYLQNANHAVELVGHTDKVGSDSYNQSLSQQRADNVKKFLVAQGIPEDRITTVGKGETEPLVKTESPEEANRRVDIKVKSGPDNAFWVETTAVGQAAAWTTQTFTPASVGKVISSENGKDVVQGNAGDSVNVNGTVLTVGTEFQMGANAAEAATNLALAITTGVTDVEAFSVDTVVHILPPGSFVRLSLFTTERSNAANSTALTASGSVEKVTSFSGGRDQSEPTENNTVTFGTTVLKVKNSGANAAANEFNKGTDAAASAANLAGAINNVATFSATASGDTVTVTGPSGTAIATSNPNAFELSATTIAGAVNLKRKSGNKATAWGATLDVHYARKFDTSVTGNSAISARLVAIPAPIELLDEVKAFLGSLPAETPLPAPPAPTSGSGSGTTGS